MPVFGVLERVTKSTQQKKHKPNNGFMFHVKANSIYGEYQVNSVNSKSLNLRCVNPVCGAIFTVETPFNHKIGARPNGKSRFGIRTDIAEDNLMNKEMYGSVSHVCGPTCIPRQGGMCSKTVHLDGCKYGSVNTNWNHRLVADRLKKRRAKDQAINAAAIVDEELAPFMPNVPLHEVAPRYMLQHDLNPRRLREVIYNADSKNKPTVTVLGVPEKLVHFTTGENGEKSQFIYEQPLFTAFILPSDLELLRTLPVVADGTFEAIKKLQGFDDRSAQLYQLSVKFNVGNRCFIYVVGQFLMKNRRKSTYDAMFDFIKELYAQTYPDNDALIIMDFHADYEQAFVNSVHAAFPGATVHLCVFHYSQSIHRHLAKIMARPTDNPILAQVWQVLKGCPYLPWNGLLKRRLIGLLNDQINSLPIRLHTQYREFISYYENNYMSNGMFTLLTQDSFWYFYHGHDDMTSNTAESINYMVNSKFNAGRKTMTSVCNTLFNFKWHHCHARIRALEQNEARYFRLRSPQIIERWQKRRDFVNHFLELDNDERESQLWQVLSQIGELGVPPQQYQNAQNPSLQ